MEERKYRRSVVWLLVAVMLTGLLEVAADVYVIAEGFSVEIVEGE